nr:phosphoribosylformylglycinamidine synthase subunit PurQ [uncultured Sphingomonas sp.]
MKTAVLVFPGSNCDRDLAVALERATGRKPGMVWHRETSLPAGLDLIGIPGGFSYGDYLRSGAMAARSPIMQAVIEQAGKGRPVLGICNGFQVLTEAGLLPGALMRNACLTFICRDADLTVANNRTLFTSAYAAGEAIRIPVAHHDGNFQADAETLARIEGEGQVVFRYDCTVNGSANDIAGLVNAGGNVLGMMPHPERAAEPAHGNEDGRRVFDSLIGAFAGA